MVSRAYTLRTVRNWRPESGSQHWVLHQNLEVHWRFGVWFSNQHTTEEYGTYQWAYMEGSTKSTDFWCDPLVNSGRIPSVFQNSAACSTTRAYTIGLQITKWVRLTYLVDSEKLTVGLLDFLQLPEEIPAQDSMKIEDMVRAWVNISDTHMVMWTRTLMKRWPVLDKSTSQRHSQQRIPASSAKHPDLIHHHLKHRSTNFEAFSGITQSESVVSFRT